MFADLFESPLCLAVKEGDAATVRALLKAGASLTARNWRGRTALHCAAIKGDEEILERTHSTLPCCIIQFTPDHGPVVLLEEGADPCVVDNEGLSALHHAARVDAEVLAVLVRALGKNTSSLDAVDLLNRSPAHHAALSGKREVLEYLFSKKCNMHLLDAYGCNLLHCASMCSLEGIQDPIAFLLKKGFGLSAQDNLGYAPLALAIASGSMEAAKALLKKQANIEITVRSHLNCFVLSFLLSLFVQDKLMRTPLHIACSHPRTEMLTLLFDHGASALKKSKYPSISH